ncbi:hypothetical protein [Spartinivicinus poritis]|uniref:Lipoprotein n=1 Tax=Spartinivicinus poritis TaxID=2994640 RepID=A0ABT5U3I3_9GAMM|nr:hypothetical protein [Spartinivicinus sp. A2-2]MDE1460923.1 hypothetical protein [Spartinivicinus sp. A2-2]
MFRMVSLIFIAFSVSGCAGLDIETLPTKVAGNAHKLKNVLKGYIVYHPMVVVEIGEKELCIAKNEKGQCIKVKTVCGIGEPKTLPDYSKPYLITPKSGFGKAGVDIKIEDGWRLGGIKDESDNTALLSVLAAAGGIETAVEGSVSDTPVSGCSQSGLYQVIPQEGEIKFAPIFKY